MANQVIQSALIRDTNEIAINALKRPGPQNELGINRSFLALLQAFGRIDYVSGGGSDAAKLKFKYASTGTAEHYGKGDPAPAAGNISAKEATVGYVRARDVLDVDNFDEAASEGAQIGTEEGLWTSHLQEAQQNIIEKVETKLVTGLGTNDEPYGLGFWINDASVLGSFDQSTDSWGAATVVDASSGALAHTFLRQGQEGAKDDNGSTIDVIISSYRQGSKYKQLMDGDVRFDTMRIADIEFAGFMYDGIPWIVLPGFPKTDIYGLKMNTLNLKIMLQKDKSNMGAQPLVGLTRAGLPFAVRPIDSQGVDSSKAQMTFYYSFFCTKPWMNWRIEALSQTL